MCFKYIRDIDITVEMKNGEALGTETDVEERKPNNIYINSISNDVIRLKYDNSMTVPQNTSASYIKLDREPIKELINICSFK